MALPVLFTVRESAGIAVALLVLLTVMAAHPSRCGAAGVSQFEKGQEC